MAGPEGTKTQEQLRIEVAKKMSTSPEAIANVKDATAFMKQQIKDRLGYIFGDAHVEQSGDEYTISKERPLTDEELQEMAEEQDSPGGGVAFGSVGVKWVKVNSEGVLIKEKD